jgi:SAM-dependent methyltransferase
MNPSYACPACGGNAQEEPVVAREMMFGRDESFTYLVCADCGTLALEEMPEDMGQYYPADYYSIDTDPEVALGRPGVRQFATSVARSILFGRRTVASAAQRVVRMRQFHSFVSVVDSVAFAGLPAGRTSAVLDVGCGSGIIVYALSLAGIRSSLGVDPFAPGDRTFHTGARLLRRNLEEMEGTFDLVMFHHSLEHVPDPGASLEAAKGLLSSDAYREYGADWVQLDAPRHVALFSRPGVDALAARHGLRVAQVRDDSTSLQFWGSEQVRRSIPYVAPTSHLISERDSIFTDDQIASWEARAARLNAAGRGDQAAWVLVKDSA